MPSVNFKKSTIWHEISHLTINDLTKNYINKIDVEKTQVSDVFVNQFYTNIETIINEYIIRAITVRLFELNGENEITENMIKHHVQNGFDNIELVKCYIAKNCEANNKFITGNEYECLLKYVLDLI